MILAVDRTKDLIRSAPPESEPAATEQASPSRTFQGKFSGMKKIREGRQGDLSLKERKELQQAKPDIELELRSDGTFKRQVTEGRWQVVGDRIVFEPVSFGGVTLEEMRLKAESSGRAFNLAFIFNPFELSIEGESLVTADPSTAVFTEFRRRW